MLRAFTFDRMVLHDVAITDDQQRMLCVATLTSSPDGLKPSMSREEKQIIGELFTFRFRLTDRCVSAYTLQVYNLDKMDIEK